LEAIFLEDLHPLSACRLRRADGYWFGVAEPLMNPEDR
jgi:hypothetical protein